MIQDKNDGRFERDMFETRDFDASKIDSQRQFHQPYNQTTNHI
jgi:hypothetical protein